MLDTPLPYEVLNRDNDIIATAPTLAHAVMAAENMPEDVRIWGCPEAEYFTRAGEVIE